jgi:exopolysaccharide biosynthesis polyprenyl glycosylphosphotransferase
VSHVERDDPFIGHDGPDQAHEDDPGGGNSPFIPQVVENPVAPRESPPLRRLLRAVDLMVIAVGWTMAHALGSLLFAGAEPRLPGLVPTVVLVGFASYLLPAKGLYLRRVCSIRSQEIARIGTSSLLLGTAAALLLTGSGPRGYVVGTALTATIVWGVLLAVERGLFQEWINVRRREGDFRAPVIVVGGADGEASSLAEFLEENRGFGFDVVAVASYRHVPADAELTHVEDVSKLVETAERCGATGVVVDAGSLSPDELSRAAQQVTRARLHAHIASGLSGVERKRIMVTNMADETFLNVRPLELKPRQLVTKRVVDVILGSIGLLLAAPILLVAAVLIWSDDRGPVLFRKERIGRDGEPFTLYKLRSMVVDAEARLAELQSANARSGPLFKADRDPRITPIGRLLRASSIDELPQLFNVLEGTMSLVGPRPALPSEVAQFDRDLLERLCVTPGLTGLWQVEARDQSNFDLYRRFDLLYVNNWSVALDLSILLRTINVVGWRLVRALVPGRSGSSRLD